MRKIQQPIILLIMLFVFITVITGCSSSGSRDVDYGKYTGATSPNFQQAVLEEVNFARTNPSGYAKERLTSGTDNGAYEDMMQRTVVGALELENNLCNAASKYAQYMAENNVFGHEEYSKPAERCKAVGYNYFSGENIAAGGSNNLNAEQNPTQAAAEFVKMLIIDKGVASLGHRNNIMSSSHKKLGVGFARNTSSTYVNYMVQDFGSK
ncbi:MAG TPA: CAP domain-containing protein [Bacillota bacterium]|nr:CAP domain-containing protein [Bacillota bacterium]